MDSILPDTLNFSVLTSDILLTGGIIFILLFLSGVFSGSETALTAASKAHIHHLSKTGNKRAKRVGKLIENKERMIGAILLGNNLVNILASALATSLFIRLAGDAGVVYATLLMTALVLIFAEVLPKSYAIANPVKMALAIAPFISFIVIIFAPVVTLVQKIVRMTLNLFGVDISSDAHSPKAQDEIRSTIDLHHHEGSLIKEDQVMIGSILDLDEVTVEDVMVNRKRMQILNIEDDPNDIIAKIVRSPFTRIPVYEGDPENIVGILHAKDVLRSLRKTGNQAKQINIKRIMIKPWFVPETSSLREQLNAFLERKSHFALVVDEYGAIQGLVTLEDILEEIVGDISDEHDFDLPGVQVHSDGSVSAEGTVTIRDINRIMDWELPVDEATTIAGLVLYEAETIPIVGQLFNFHGYNFEVTSRRRNQITGIKVKKNT
jgi:Mg2+/Co2+ transporter CorB